MDNFVDETILGTSYTDFEGIDASEIVTVQISDTETEDIKYYPMCTFDGIVGQCIDDSPLIFMKYGLDYEVSSDTVVPIFIGINPRHPYEYVHYYHCAKYSEIRNSDKQQVTISMDRDHPETSDPAAETYKFNGDNKQLSKLRMRGSRPEDELDAYARTMYDSQNCLVRLRDVMIVDRVFTITFNFVNWNVPINTPVEQIFDYIDRIDGQRLQCTYSSYAPDMQSFRFLLDKETAFSFLISYDCQDIPNRYKSFTYTINNGEEQEFMLESNYDIDYVTEDLTFNIIAEVIERRKISLSSQGDLNVIDASTGATVMNYYDTIATYLTSYDHLSSATFKVTLTNPDKYEGIYYFRTYYNKNGYNLIYSDNFEQYVNDSSCIIPMDYIEEDNPFGAPAIIPNISPRKKLYTGDWTSATLEIHAKERYIPIKIKFIIRSNINVSYELASESSLKPINVQNMDNSPSQKIDVKYPSVGYLELENEGESVYVHCSWTSSADDPTHINYWFLTPSSGRMHTMTAGNQDMLRYTPTRDMTLYIDTIRTDVVTIRIDKLPDTIRIFENYYNEYIEGDSYTTMGDSYYNNKTFLTFTETGENDILTYSMQRMSHEDDTSIGSPDRGSAEAKVLTYTNTNLYVGPDYYYKLTVRSMKKYIPKAVNIYFLDSTEWNRQNLTIEPNIPAESDTVLEYVGEETTGSVQDVGQFYYLKKYTMTAGFDLYFRINLLPAIKDKYSSIEYFLRGYTDNWLLAEQSETENVPNVDGIFDISMENGVFDDFYDYNEIDIFVRPSSIPVYQYSVSSEDNHINIAVWGDDWDNPDDTSTVITENQETTPSAVIYTSYKHNNQYKLKLWCTNELYLNYSYIISDVDGGFSRIVGSGTGTFPENGEYIEYVSPEGFFEQYGNGTLIQFGALPETILYWREDCEIEPKKWLMIPPRTQGSRDIFIRIE